MIEWSETFELGIESIDDQHKKWISIMNRLMDDQISKVEQSNKVVLQLGELNEYAMFHFKYEEKLFEEYGYSEMLEHRKTHLQYAQRLNQYQLEASQGKVPVLDALLAEMTEWLIHHICTEDRKYVDFLKSKGVL